ncbi:HAD family hydrolase [Geomonas sp. Red32]|uniref:HAD family hydrolase n=1 Tax=Geomonas sp. Red32 TaxID=2912856 RepID=UPI00202CDFBF|nr:HAD family hydrolase [Geomonas sp. Red32]MCM0084446.1 HAD family hydrolase [Geomonas sp. Red32]
MGAELIKAIVFDLDGTLYQNEQMGGQVNLSACRYIAELKGVSVEQADLMLEEARDSLAGLAATLSQAVISLGGNMHDLHERMAREVRPEGLLAVDERVVGLLKDLASRFGIHIYTNNNRSLSARIMKLIGVADFFCKVFTIEDFWRPKPDEETLIFLLDAIGAKAEETLFVGDRYQVDLALPATLGAKVFESCTIEQLLGLREFLAQEPTA